MVKLTIAFFGKFPLMARAWLQSATVRTKATQEHSTRRQAQDHREEALGSMSAASSSGIPAAPGSYKHWSTWGWTLAEISCIRCCLVAATATWGISTHNETSAETTRSAAPTCTTSAGTAADPIGPNGGTDSTPSGQGSGTEATQNGGSSWSGHDRAFVKVVCTESSTSNPTSPDYSEDAGAPSAMRGSHENHTGNASTANSSELDGQAICRWTDMKEPSGSPRWGSNSPDGGIIEGLYCGAPEGDGTGLGGIISFRFSPFTQPEAPLRPLLRMPSK